jgi:hypothetical protein
MSEKDGSARWTPNEYFLPADNINCEVIQRDIWKYLGPGTTVQPCTGRDVSTDSDMLNC